MASVRKWSNVAVAVQSSLAAPVTINAITKANPGVVTYTGTDPVNGEYVVLNIQGMFQLDGMVVRVTNVNAGSNTFELEGIDTTAFETFISGTFEVITFGTSITSATTVNPSGGDLDFIDTTTIHKNFKTQIPGASNPSNLAMDHHWDISDAGLLALKSAADAEAKRAFKFTFGVGGQIMVFSGYVGATLLPAGQAQDKVTTPTVITMFSRPMYYGS